MKNLKKTTSTYNIEELPKIEIEPLAMFIKLPNNFFVKINDSNIVETTKEIFFNIFPVFSIRHKESKYNAIISRSSEPNIHISIRTTDLNILKIVNDLSLKRQLLCTKQEKV